MRINRFDMTDLWSIACEMQDVDLSEPLLIFGIDICEFDAANMPHVDTPTTTTPTPATTAASATSSISLLTPTSLSYDLPSLDIYSDATWFVISYMIVDKDSGSPTTALGLDGSGCIQKVFTATATVFSPSTEPCARWAEGTRSGSSLAATFHLASPVAALVNDWQDDIECSRSVLYPRLDTPQQHLLPGCPELD